MYTLDNTDGYTQAELDSLNGEFQKRIEDLEVRLEADELDEMFKAFANEVSSR